MKAKISSKQASARFEANRAFAGSRTVWNSRLKTGAIAYTNGGVILWWDGRVIAIRAGDGVESWISQQALVEELGTDGLLQETFSLRSDGYLAYPQEKIDQTAIEIDLDGEPRPPFVKGRVRRFFASFDPPRPGRGVTLNRETDRWERPG